ncbi:hypothetical protein [Pseudobacter ginsenosidimutans]|uniref:Uncharacterized protein n=1 Tax=Pseudobacter ginsenosidimutans TaxID=661488 RepID=A0A4Q7MB28_9BACT|nr:hypothetical protein [Pseudobacter ginsenosidimutans]QEC42589.1 hypothetical protein FSB84_13125 [Pseudobacter ginsenosidimutans]RZS63922.1 hypothetical protein EV199_6022 [Pseudobacter ginsenosidimutans]
MQVLLLISCLCLAGSGSVEKSRADSSLVLAGIEKNRELSILFPKNNQKVRGEYKVYGKARPGSVVVLHISSTYYKTARDSRQKVSKGAGPINRMNRKFKLTADRSGNWILKNIELWNAGWEENFTIKATAENKTVSIRVYDNTHPVAID